MAIPYITTRQNVSFKSVKLIESHLEDVMELISIEDAEKKLNEIEAEYEMFPDQLNMARLGIVYHENALNLASINKGNSDGYATKSFTILHELFTSEDIFVELLPFIAGYHASARALMGSEKTKPGYINESFKLFESAVSNYGEVCFCPEFLRAGISDKLPWFFFNRKRHAKQDYESIITRQQLKLNYAPTRIMSFSYFGWAKQSQSKKDRARTLEYLEKSIQLDPKYKAARKRAEELKNKLLND